MLLVNWTGLMKSCREVRVQLHTSICQAKVTQKVAQGLNKCTRQCDTMTFRLLDRKFDKVRKWPPFLKNYFHFVDWLLDLISLMREEIYKALYSVRFLWWWMDVHLETENEFKSIRCVWIRTKWKLASKTHCLLKRKFDCILPKKNDIW